VGENHEEKNIHNGLPLFVLIKNKQFLVPGFCWDHCWMVEICKNDIIMNHCLPLLACLLPATNTIMHACMAYSWCTDTVGAPLGPYKIGLTQH